MPDATDSRHNDTFTISDLAREFDLTTRAIRFYEDQGLLNPSREGRKRIYDRRDRTRLKLTLRGKRLGFSLNEIREIIDLFDETGEGEELQLRRYLDTLDSHRAQLERQRRDIEATLRDIDKARAECLQRLALNEPVADPV